MGTTRKWGIGVAEAAELIGVDPETVRRYFDADTAARARGEDAPYPGFRMDRGRRPGTPGERRIDPEWAEQRRRVRQPPATPGHSG